MSVSIIIPVFNQQKFLGRALRSAIASKDFCDVEIIAVNDASTDHTQDVLESFGDSIRVLKNDTNLGLPYSLNRVLLLLLISILFDWIVIIGFTQNFPKSCPFFWLNNSIDAVASDYYIVDEMQERIAHMSSVENPIGCAIMFRKEHLIDIGLYDQDMLWHENELMLRFRNKYFIHHILCFIITFMVQT